MLKYTNNAVATLAVAVNDVATELQLSSGIGFPVLLPGQTFHVTLEAIDSSVREICLVTARDGDTLTVQRGYDNTAARAWNLGTPVAHRLVAADMTALVEGYLPLAGGTMTGQITLPGGGTGDQAVTYDEVAALVNGIPPPVLDGYVEKAGDTMTGALTLAGAPTQALHAATKAYADLHLPLTGGTLSGTLTLPGGGTGDQAVTFNDVSGRLIPAGGGPGYSLVKATGDDYDVTWAWVEGSGGGGGGEYVLKAGDTMTGALVMQDAQIRLRNMTAGTEGRNWLLDQSTLNQLVIGSADSSWVHNEYTLELHREADLETLTRLRVNYQTAEAAYTYGSIFEINPPPSSNPAANPRVFLRGPYALANDFDVGFFYVNNDEYSEVTQAITPLVSNGNAGFSEVGGIFGIGLDDQSQLVATFGADPEMGRLSGVSFGYEWLMDTYYDGNQQNWSATFVSDPLSGDVLDHGFIYAYVQVAETTPGYIVGKPCIITQPALDTPSFDSVAWICGFYYNRDTQDQEFSFPLMRDAASNVPVITSIADTFGAQVSYGFDVTQVTTNGTGAGVTDSTVDVTGGVYFSNMTELGRHYVDSASNELIYFLYRDGANGYWKTTSFYAYDGELRQFPYLIASWLEGESTDLPHTDRPVYNKYDVGTGWSLEEVPNSKYIHGHLLATNIALNRLSGQSGGFNPVQTRHGQMMWVVGQEVFDTLEDAQAAALTAYQRLDVGQELWPQWTDQTNHYKLWRSWAPIATFVIEVDDTLASGATGILRPADAAGSDYIDHRTTLRTSIPGTNTGVTDHGALAGLGDDDHSQYALADGTRGSFAKAFTDLTDAPAAYTGSGGYIVKVKSTEDGLEFAASGGGGVTDHGALTGLSDDDHSQYALADGTRGSFAAVGHDHSGVYQPADADLTALAGLTVAENALIVGNGDPAWSVLSPPTPAGDGHFLKITGLGVLEWTAWSNPPPGVEDFTDLGDVPAAYTGAGGYVVKVKSTEDGLEFAAASSGVTDHGALTGLSDDDHSQYALADGTRGAFQRYENGFPNRTDSTISFTDGTRTLSIAPASTSFTFTSNMVRYTKNSAQTVVITDTEGLHFVYFDGDGVLQSTTTFSESLILTYALVAVVYWDAANDQHLLLADERHGDSMSAVTHLFHHVTEGTRYETGLGLGDLTVGGDGSSATHVQFSVANGVIWDEDIKHTITDGSPQDLSPTAQLPIFYRSGTSTWRRIAATGYCVTTTGTGRAAYNQNVAGTWQLTEASDNSYVLSHVVATNDTEYPVVILCGQANYSGLNAAQAGAATEAQNLALGGLDALWPEWVLLATVIVQTRDNYTNTVNSRIVATADGASYIDWRVASVAGIGGISVSDHGQLGGLSDDDHTQYALADGTRGSFAAVGHDHSGVYQPADAQLTDLAGLGITKGNLIVADGTNWAALGVGTNDYVLIADSTQTLGVKWATLPSGVTDHGALTGLSDDDHTQYLLASGTRAATGLGVGVAATSGRAITIQAEYTDVNTSGVTVLSVIQPTNTASMSCFRTAPITAAASFTLSELRHFVAQTQTPGAGSAITSQYGFSCEMGAIAGSNYAFYSNLASGTNRWNLYMSGTAANYIEGSLGIGNSSVSDKKLRIAGNFPATSASYALLVDGAFLSAATSDAKGIRTGINVSAGGTVSWLTHFEAVQGTFSSTVTNQYGFAVSNTLTGATNNYGFYGNIPAGTNRWNLYMPGTAINHLAGALLIGTTSDNATDKLQVSGTAVVTSPSSGANNTQVATTAWVRTYASGAYQPLDNDLSDIAALTPTKGKLMVGDGTDWVALGVGTNDYVLTADSAQASGVKWAASGSGVTDHGALTGLSDDDHSQYLLVAGTRAATKLGIGSAPSSVTNFALSADITGGTSAWGQAVYATVQSGVTVAASGIDISLSTVAASFTLADLACYRASLGTIGAGSTVTAAYGFYGNIAAGTGRYNLYMASTAYNYLAGPLFIGEAPASQRGLVVGLAHNATGTNFGIAQTGEVQSASTGTTIGFYNVMKTQAASFTLGYYIHFYANQGTKGSGSAITDQRGFYVSDTMTGATTNYGFFGNLVAASGRWNLYMNGDAWNYLAGSLGIGQSTLTGKTLALGKTMTGSTNPVGIENVAVIQSDATVGAYGFNSQLGTAAAAFTCGVIKHFRASQDTKGSGSTITTQIGYMVESTLTGGTSNYGFYGDIASGSNRWNLYMAGTALNMLNGVTLIGTTSDNGVDKLQVSGTAVVTSPAAGANNTQVATTAWVRTYASGAYQPLDSDLTALAGLAVTKGNLIVGTGSAWAAQGVGSNSTVLIADSTQTNGVRWTSTLWLDSLRIANHVWFDEVVDNGNSGTADTIDWTVGNKQKSTLTGNCTFTFTAPNGPTDLRLGLIQDGTGGRAVTWPATVKWPGGTAPALSTGANDVNIVSLFYDGTNYYATALKDFG